MKKEEFKQLSKEVLPAIETIRQVLEKYGVDDTCLSSLVLSPEGYFNFSVNDSDITLVRLEDGVVNIWDQTAPDSIVKIEPLFGEEGVYAEDKR